MIPVVEFGKRLFAAEDLDPVYVALLGSSLPRDQLARWLVAYWCFYNSGFACWASERRASEYWGALSEAAENTTLTPFCERWSRGTERRHFRGKASVEAIARLRQHYAAQPEDMVDFLLTGPLSVRAVMGRAKSHYLFGDWIAFKVADMLDAVCAAEVLQDDLTVFLYETPRQSIVEGWKTGVLPLKATKEEDALVEGMYWLQRELKASTIPHKPGKSPDWFSLETVWCKHLSHQHGFYPIFKDIKEIGHGLQPWLKYSETAARFWKALPSVGVFKT